MVPAFLPHCLSLHFLLPVQVHAPCLPSFLSPCLFPSLRAAFPWQQGEAAAAVEPALKELLHPPPLPEKQPQQSMKAQDVCEVLLLLLLLLVLLALMLLFWCSCCCCYCFTYGGFGAGVIAAVAGGGGYDSVDRQPSLGRSITP